MNKQPTYTAEEIRHMANIFDYLDYKILLEQINEELELYSSDDLIIIIQASMIILIKTLVNSNIILTKGSIQ